MKIETKAQLRELYDNPKGRSVTKQLNQLEKHSINFIAHSPFLIVSTYGKQGGVDVSPKGGCAGFVKALNNETIFIPDSKGNNRLDGFENLIETGQIGTLFMIPGVDETLRINGKGTITTDSHLLTKFKDDRNPPKCGIVIHVEEVYLHCAKALMRSKLWFEDVKINRENFPSMGQMINDQLNIKETPESNAQMVNRYQSDL